MKLPSASSLDRALNCPASVVLPQVQGPRGKYANRGTAVHAFLETAMTKGRDAALGQVNDEDARKLCEAIDLNTMPQDPSMYAAEVAFAWCYVTDTGRELGRNRNRDYSSRKPSEFTGTADIVATGDDVVYVPDFKTGGGYVPAARWNPQLMFAALAASRAYGKSSAIVEIIRIKDDGTTYRDRAELDAFDLDDFAGRLRRLVERLHATAAVVTAGRDPDTAEGGWCTYCPAKKHCPAKVGTMRKLLELPAGVELTPDNIADIARAALAGRDLLEQVKEIARETPIQLGPGRWYGRRGNGVREYSTTEVGE